MMKRVLQRAILHGLLLVFAVCEFLWRLLVSRSPNPAQVSGKQPAPAKSIALVLTEQSSTVQSQKVVQLLAWCAASGVEDLFLYDPAGLLKSLAPGLEALAAREGCSLRLDFQVGWKVTAEGSAAGLANKPRCSNGRLPMNGTSSQGVCKVTILGPDDGITPVIGALSAGVISTNKPCTPLRKVYEDCSLMRQRLAGASSSLLLKEPQLILVFGPVLTLGGYPPLHTRNSEIFHMGLLHDTTAKTVSSAFQRYKRVHQRFGA